MRVTGPLPSLVLRTEGRVLGFGFRVLVLFSIGVFFIFVNLPVVKILARIAEGARVAGNER